MHLRKKIKVTLMLVLVCLVLTVAATYAWLVLSSRPEVHNIETNIGANGSLEIALLTEQTFADPLLIRTAIGDSAVVQDALEFNKTWGNVIELNDQRYGLDKITLLPARLNVLDSGEQYSVAKNLLKTAKFGLDGRITILSEETVSAVANGDEFTYYVDRQQYGVRAIGTISNISSQQKALSYARTAVKSYTAAASRTAKYTWRDYGAQVMDILIRHYAEGEERFAADHITGIRNMAEGMLNVAEYLEYALRQGVIGMAASQIADEDEFAYISDLVGNTATPLSALAEAVEQYAPEGFATWVTQVDTMKLQMRTVIANCYSFAAGGSWEQIQPMLETLMDPQKTYLGETLLSEMESFDDTIQENEITVLPDSGVMAGVAAYVGNYSAFAMYADTVSFELITTDTTETPCLLQVEDVLENRQAATGGWTRANIDDTYGFAVDMAFRSNQATDLLLQTEGALRVEEDSEYPVTQGGGSYMRFSSENMEQEQLLQLMDTIRVGFISDQNTLLGVAKLSTADFREEDDGVFAPLYLYEYTLEDGVLTIDERRSNDGTILPLAENSPAVVSVVVWLDGDHVDNSMVSDIAPQSMNGVLNLQFSSSVDLHPAGITISN